MANIVDIFDEYDNAPRFYRQRYTPLDIDELTNKAVQSVYRFSKNNIMNICDDLEEDLLMDYIVDNLKGKPLTAQQQVTLALKFYGHGSTYRSLGEQYGVGIGSVSRVISNVTNSIIQVYGPTMRMPLTRERCQLISRDFFDLAGFPNVIGCVDGSLIPIIRPHENEHVFVSRKGYHAINIMCVCTSNLEFIYVDTKFPGSTQDAAVYRESNLRQAFLDGLIPQGYLLGDSGYGISRHLLTPIQNPVDRAEMDYNRAHRRTRNVVERAFGVLKSRFRCIDKNGGPLRLVPRKSARVISAVTLLHNKAIELDQVLDHELIIEEAVDDDDVFPEQDIGNDRQIRNRVVKFFRN